MPKSTSIVSTLFWNVVLTACWHICVFMACVKLPPSFFDSRKRRYQPLSWEHGGKWYKDHLKIQLWKDKVPQFIGKDGFSKSHITGLSLEYLNEFIMETCRGEWMHLANCLCAVVVFVIRPCMVDFVLSALILLGNLPFAIIQRYNRFRLETVKKRLLRDMSHVSEPARVAV